MRRFEDRVGCAMMEWDGLGWRTQRDDRPSGEYEERRETVAAGAKSEKAESRVGVGMRRGRCAAWGPSGSARHEQEARGCAEPAQKACMAESWKS